jgi:Uma2 family endonuclease
MDAEMSIATTVKLTYEDIRSLPDDGKRHELIDGEHIMTPAPRTKHQRASMNLSRLLDTFVLEHSIGEVFAAPVDVVFSENDAAQPDIVFISSPRANLITEDNVLGAPDLVIEILSPSTANIDRKIKFRLYEKHGVREYWLVSPEAENVQIFVLREDKFELLGNFSGKQEVPSRVLSGFVCQAEEVFAV